MRRSPWSTTATATAACILLLQLLTSQTNAHMEMSKPYPINSQLDPSVPEQLKDYSYTSPLLADGSNFPCKGYQNQRPVVRSASYEAGKTYTMDIYGTATHGGGSCQISLSYDNGKTFRVIKSMVGGCPLSSSYDFTVPEFAPAGTALLAWTWMNLVGNREYYMNCAWVDIAGSAAAQGGGGSSSSHNGPLSGPEYTAPGSSPSPPRRKKGKGRKALKGNALSASSSSSSSSSSVASNETDVAELVRRKTYTSFDQLPFIWKANLPPENNCVTVEGVTPVFPDPGPDVVYGSGVSASTPPSNDLSCDAAGPPGPAYKNLPIGPFGQYAGVGGGSGGGGSGGTTTSAPLPTTTSTSATLTLITSIASPTLPSIPSPTLSSIPSPTLPSIPSPTLPSVPSPTLPGFPSASPSVRPIRHSRCDSSISGQGLKCLRKGTGFAICDNNYWVDMGPVAYGTKCQGPAGRAIIVASGWA